LLYSRRSVLKRDCRGGGVKTPLILPIRMGRYEAGVQYWCISQGRHYRHICLTKVIALE
jgi:hypothetical protein